MTDREQIQETVLAYATCIDRREPAALAAEVFAPDAEVNLGYGTWTSAEQTAREIGAELDEFEGTAHVLTNHRIAVEGDAAKSSVYVTAWHWDAGNEGDPDRGADWVTVGVYVDRLERLAQGWRITNRRFIRLGPSAIALGTLPAFITSAAEYQQAASKPA